MNKTLRWAVAAALVAAAALAQAQDRPRSHSSLYYRIGGGDPAARAANPRAIAMRLGLGGSLRLNYSCGRFDLGVSWANMMNGFSQLGTQIQGAVRAGIASLPMYIFQRAQPGLYELFQTYSQKADVMVQAALKSCEEMEAQIRAGKDPYEDWMGLAKSESWKVESRTNGDVVNAKARVETNAGRDGLYWIGGRRAGGENQQPITLVRDLVTAGYNVTMNQGVLSNENADFMTAAPALAQTRLARAFRHPADAARYAQDVLGEMHIAICEPGAPNCPTKGTSTGLGLGPKYEAEIPSIESTLATLVSGANPDYALLDEIGAPGVAIGREVIDALRELPAYERAILMARLTKEIALARTIDKALAIRNLILTGVTLPEVTVAGIAGVEAQKKTLTLNRYIDDLMYENRVRKEIVADTAQALLEAYRSIQARSTTNGAQRRIDPNPLRDGRVQP